ncbi:dihydrofolate reductase family protein [Pedobacter arcticus]|uniref:dihydrofolate reductase family protein n=1 Tax=Pedobacter arcticus TaxID=752140 RepID=UPI0003140F34|nr:dihydrofolate reductase family protein [Pedobacter arcticus]
MRKLIAGINMTLDGVCDHTAVDADGELHQHYADLLKNADVVLYGRITYQLMEFWRTLAEHPSGEKSMDDFAIVMDNIPKVVFSRTLKKVDWKSAKLANQDLEETVLALKKQSGKPILVGCRSLIIQLIELDLIDEFQLCIHPVVAGSGLSLFENISRRAIFKLIKTKTLSSGAIIIYYKPTIK